MAEAPFDLQVCRDWWRRKWALGVQHPPTWPEMSQAWFNGDLNGKRIRARIFVRQILARRSLADKVVPIARARGYRATNWPLYLRN
jgi:hypothetical protein